MNSTLYFPFLLYFTSKVKKIKVPIIRIVEERTNPPNRFSLGSSHFDYEKNGSMRVCIEYHWLNKLTIHNKHHFPRIDKLFDYLQRSTIFSKIYLSSGYYQLKIRAEDIPKTTFRTYYGHYEFLVMYFYLTNAPMTFISLMNGVLSHFWILSSLSSSMKFYFTPRVKKSMKLIYAQYQVFLRRSNYTLNIPSEISSYFYYLFLGHMVSKERVVVDPQKVEAVKYQVTLMNIIEISSILGLGTFY